MGEVSQAAQASPHVSDTLRAWIRIALLAAAFAAMYLLLLPGNRSETDDGFGYAYQVRTVPWDWHVDPQHALLIPLGKLISGFADPYAALVGLSLVLGVMSIALFFWTLLSLGYSQAWALIGAALLGASYGFWRYAVEAETYTLGTVTALLLLVGTVRRWRLPLVIALGALALSAHLVNVAVVLGAVVVAMLLRREFSRLRWYLAVMLPLALALALGLVGSDTPIQPLVGQDVLRIPIGIGQSVVAANGLLGLPGVEEAVSTLFAGRDLTAEAVIAQASAGTVAWASALTLGLVVIASFGVFVAFVRAQGSTDLRGLWVFGSWLTCYAFPAMTQERGNPELWIIAIVPLWGVMMSWGQRCGPRPPGAAFALAAALTTHTIVAGLAPVQSQGSDVNYLSTVYLREHAPRGSLVITDDNQVLTRYMRYELPVTVINLETQSLPTDLSVFPAVYVMPSAVDQVPYRLVHVDGVYRVVPE